MTINGRVNFRHHMGLSGIAASLRKRCRQYEAERSVETNNENRLCVVRDFVLIVDERQPISFLMPSAGNIAVARPAKYEVC